MRPARLPGREFAAGRWRSRHRACGLRLGDQADTRPTQSSSMTPGPELWIRLSRVIVARARPPRMATHRIHGASHWSGSFKDIVGTVISTDAANNSITITILQRKPVTSEVARFPAAQAPQFAAMGIAMRLKGWSAGAAQGVGTGASVSGNRPQASAGGGGNWRGANGASSGMIQAQAPGGPNGEPNGGR